MDRDPILPRSVSLLCCPECKGDLNIFGSTAVCSACTRSYPFRFGILDLRDHEKDHTAGFQIENDIRVAHLMHESYATSTYIELYDLYCEATQRAKGESLHARQQKAKQSYRQMLVNLHSVHGKAILRKINNYVKDMRPAVSVSGIALEDGAGLGQFVDGFSSHFDMLFVLDLSLCYLVLAKKLVDDRRLDNVVLICGNVERLPIREGVIDFVHSNNMIEHVSNARAMFEEAWRVLRKGGLFFVLSPNRFSLYLEPHYRLPAIGFIPMPIRRMLVRLIRCRDDLENIRLHSLLEINRLARATFGSSYLVTFLPRTLGQTTLQTPIRRIIRCALDSKLLGKLAHFLLNRVFLGVMPYHVALCVKGADSGRTGAMLTNRNQAS